MATKKKKAVKKIKTIAERVIARLGKVTKPQTSEQLARAVGSPASSVSSACRRLVMASKLKRTDGGGRGTEALWALA